MGAYPAYNDAPFTPQSPATSNFDYYEYFSNYNRLLTTPPQSPDGLYNPRVEDMSPEARGPRLGGTRFVPEEAAVNKKFWRRSGPPKYELVTESPERLASQLQPTGRHPLEGLHPLDLRQGPSPPSQRKLAATKLKRVPSSPSSPLSPDSAAPPLLSPPYEAHALPFPGPSSSGRAPYRISFIETNVYIPRDVPSSSASPEHLPHARFHKHLHGEWVIDTVQQLKEHFKPPTTQILVNVEKKAKYPFIIFGTLGPGFDTRPIVPSAATNSLSPELRISDGVYDICGSLTRLVTAHFSPHVHVVFTWTSK